MQSFRAAARDLGSILGRTLLRSPATDTRLTVQQASDTLKQLRQRDEVQSGAGGHSMRYPAMVIGFLQVCIPIVCTAASKLTGGRGSVCHAS